MAEALNIPKHSIFHSIDASSKAFDSWKQRSLADRGQTLLNCSAALETQKQELTNLLCAENGKPALDAALDVAFIIQVFGFFGSLIDKLPGQFMIAESSILPLSGSRLAPLTVMRIIEILQTVLPKGVVQAIPGAGAEVAQLLIESPAVKMISLTGSTAAGAAVAKTASKLVKRTALEIGGKNAFIVFDDCDMDRAVKGALEGAYLSKDWPLQYADCESEMDLTSRNGLVKSYIALGSEEGAKIAAQADLPSDPSLKDGYFVALTLFRDVVRTMRIAQEEIFGPVATVCSFSSEEEAVFVVNESRYGLVAVIWAYPTVANST
ncbi:dehydrogenase [Metarhizium acridum CQMa 102]|uniref:Dehydrogenase n=1 Tax=Metarhizium acridum (strain CQMa 102) TaxID=655827 RepID=E9E9S3_METAQ|nr:dehydrogenase [Metarhizium acridum CQMa 102]EFY87386.1 dehydrogenase [Metarhizium acridum CQMa 102]